MTAAFMHQLSLHDNAQACKQVQPGWEDAVAGLAEWVVCNFGKASAAGE